jgi:hypothetical protein
VAGLVRTGATTAYEVALALPWTRRDRRFAELALTHQMTAVLEIDAHLEVLAMHGVVALTETDPVRRFALTA